MAIRTYKVTLDSKNTIAPEPVYLRQGDKTGAVVIDATLMDNGSQVSLSGLTPMFKANTADGQAVIADSTGFKVTDSANGEFTYQVPNALSAAPGKITTAYFSFSDSSGTESTFDVAFIIKKAVDITQAQADDYITIIDGTLKSLSDKIDAMNTDVQTIINAYKQGDFYNKAQTDSKDAATLASAKSYADYGDSATLTSAKKYADAQDATLTQALSEFYLKNTGIGFGDGSNTPIYTSDSDIALSGLFSIPSFSSNYPAPVKAKDTKTLLIQKNGYYNISFNTCASFPNNHNWGVYSSVELLINGVSSGGTLSFGIDNGTVAINVVRSLNSGDTIKFKSYVNTSKGVVLYSPHGSVKYMSGK